MKWPGPGMGDFCANQSLPYDNTGPDRRWNFDVLRGPFVAWVRCAFFDGNLHSMMPLVPTPARLTLLHACDPMAFLSGVHFLTGVHCKFHPNTEGQQHSYDWFGAGCGALV
jgi:hypothetical protein